MLVLVMAGPVLNAAGNCAQLFGDRESVDSMVVAEALSGGLALIGNCGKGCDLGRHRHAVP